MTRRSVQAVLFDFGNTLFAHEPLAATIREVASSLGTTVTTNWAQSLARRIEVAAHTEAELARHRDLDSGVWSSRWHELYAMADVELPGLGRVIYQAMHEPASWVPFAKSAQTLRDLGASGVRIGVVSNTGWDIRSVFRLYGIDKLIDAFVLSYEVGFTKPAPAIFLAACTKLGSDPAATMMVGDDAVSDGGAIHAGLRTLLLQVPAPGGDNGIGSVNGLVTGLPFRSPRRR